ncbi:TIGR00730 family Rossman fold protein [Actinospongicola halichondriae]|uniref:LOG family protein n=1 Tax=Actinospongicola halichondriae TaxID=3236844 RepID=UPI003D50826B
MSSPDTGNEVSRTELEALLARVGSARNRDLLLDILRTALGLAGDDVTRLNLKITASALREMRTAFATFRPYEDAPKVTMFGSARTRPDDPLYEQARRLAAELAARDWMVITGAGPGIMAAGLEGAGRENSFGVTIRLPFEESANEFIEGDEKLVSMKYFFTRKLMLVKESAGFVALPGGFGTQDETFELFTLQQTGKSVPAPVVLLDTPGGTYWHSWLDFVRKELVDGGLVNEADLELFVITDDVDTACEEIVGFYRNYHSIRWAGDQLVIRMQTGPTPAQLAALNASHGDLLVDGAIEVVEAGPAERSSRDNVELPRIGMTFDKYRQSGIHSVIREVNRWVA